MTTIYRRVVKALGFVGKPEEITEPLGTDVKKIESECWLRRIWLVTKDDELVEYLRSTGFTNPSTVDFKKLEEFREKRATHEIIEHDND